MPAPGMPIGGGSPKGYQQISPAVATGFTVPAGATVAYAVVEVAPARWRDDGTAPTTALGMLIPIGGAVTFSGKLSAVQFIAASAGALVNVAYY